MHVCHIGKTISRTILINHFRAPNMNTQTIRYLEQNELKNDQYNQWKYLVADVNSKHG